MTKRDIRRIGAGIFVVVIGCVALLRKSATTYFILTHLPQAVDQLGPFATFFGIVNVFIFSCFVVGGTAFLFRRRWGEILVTASLVVGIVLRLSACLYARYKWFTMERLIIIEEQSYVASRSMLVTYLLLIAEIAALYLISYPKMRRLPVKRRKRRRHE